jgi:hypothetical protein
MGARSVYVVKLLIRKYPSLRPANAYTCPPTKLCRAGLSHVKERRSRTILVNAKPYAKNMLEASSARSKSPWSLQTIPNLAMFGHFAR